VKLLNKGQGRIAIALSDENFGPSCQGLGPTAHPHVAPECAELQTLLIVVLGLGEPSLIKIIHANKVSLAAMNAEILTLDLRRSVAAVEVPVVFMLGHYDRQLDAHLAATYFDTLRAPAKSLIWFEHSAHNIPFEEPDRFNEVLQKELGLRMPELSRQMGNAW
jgi:pimeloyl-ACP methyl ester carboxylesterase